MKSKTYSNRKKKPSRLLYAHLVFHTKYNRKMLNGNIRDRAEEIVRDILKDLECEVVKIKVYPNYIHIFIGYPPKLAMSRIANKVKGKSSCLLRREFPILVEQCPKALWAPKYGLYSK
ncbi:MAG: IS200/IS605 family transposase [Candidatus Aminicenantes bacterium]|nr:MAG: IS200/IS605 family transposase [Candidatus Aminicenantes bacterium]